MKNRLKGLLALTLSLVMVLALATNAWAITVSVNHQSLYDDGYVATDYNGGTATLNIVTVDGVDTYVLTLDNFVSLYGSPLYADDSLTLKLIGTNAIAAASSGGSHAVNVIGDLTIEGDGELSVIGKEDDSHSCGINAKNITINSGKVLATGTDIGIAAQMQDSTVTINGGTVNAAGGRYGIIGYAGVSISDSTVTATGGEDGIRVDAGDVSISDSTVNATGDKFGIIAQGDVSISGNANVTAAADDAGGVGVSANRNINISGSANGDPTVKANCSIGLQADTVNILPNSTVRIEAADSAISCANLNFGGNWYQWSTDNSEHYNSAVSPLDIHTADANGTLYISVNTLPAKYTVKFDANGGSGTMNDATDVSGDYTLPANGFTAPAGKEFIGWSVDPAGAERMRPGEQMQITKDTTLYAIWKSTGGNGGQGPIIPQPYPPYTPTPEPEVTAPKTFDSGVALHIGLTILAASGSAWLAKKKD